MRRYKIKAKDAYDLKKEVEEDESKDRELYIKKKNDTWIRYKIRMPSFDKSWYSYLLFASILLLGLVGLTIGLSQNLQNQIDRLIPVITNNTATGGILSGSCTPTIPEICTNQTHYNWLFFCDDGTFYSCNGTSWHYLGDLNGEDGTGIISADCNPITTICNNETHAGWILFCDDGTFYTCNV